MNLLEVIHMRWEADETLNGLLPVAKLMTGIQSGAIAPYAVVSLASQAPSIYSNTGATIDTILVRFAVLHNQSNYDEGLVIANAVKSAFHDTDFDLSGDDRVLAMRRSGYEESQDEKNDWHFIIDFTCTTYLSAGV